MSNSEQRKYWNEDAGRTWVVQADGLDSMLQQTGDAMLTRTSMTQGDRVLDVGCGSGALTFSVQDRLGPSGKALGLDISTQLLELARQRAARRDLRTEFIEADAAIWASEVLWDGIVSRFGVMFFDDPVIAFSNLARLCRPGANLNFVCWCSPKESDMARGLMGAVAPLFAMPSAPADPNAPGPYAFANRERTSDILQAAGWRDLDFERHDAQLPLPGRDIRESAAFIAGIGVIGRLMREQNVAMEQVIDALLPFLEERIQDGKIVLRGGAWLVSARRN